MRQPNESYLNGNNSTVQITLAHDTSEVQVFNSPLFGDIRVITDEMGNPLFCASDVCNQLGYSNGRKAVQDHVDSEDVTKRDTLTKRGTQSMTYVNESGLYALILSSKLPNAKSYKNWVTKDVLPTIRKTGSYSIQQQFPVPQSFGEALMLAAQQQIQIEAQQKQLMQKEEEIIELKAENVELQKQSEYTRVILQSKQTVLVTQIAQDYGMSARKFNLLLRDLGIQHKVRNQWILYGKYLNKGYVHSTTHNYTHTNGSPDVSLNTEWTQKGRLFLYEELKKHSFIPLIEREMTN